MIDKDFARSSDANLGDSLEHALRSAVWLTSSDHAAVALARRLAFALDVAFDTGEGLKDVPQLSARYLSVLQQLHMTVETRVASKQGDETDGTSYVGDYLRLVNTTAGKSKTGSPKRGATGQ